MNTLAVRLLLIISVAVTSVATGHRSFASEVANSERIRRVENGLLPIVVVDGAPGSMSLLKRMQEDKIPGLSVAVIQDYRLAWSHSYGVRERGGASVDANTLFDVGSLSKTVTAIVTLHLVQEGKLDLDEDVNHYLKIWKIPESKFGGKVTLRALLSHSSGISGHWSKGYLPGAALPTLDEILRGVKPAQSEPLVIETPPGTFNYSSGGYAVVQQILENVTGKKLSDLSRQIVFEKIGMKRTTYQPPDQENGVTRTTGYDPEGKQLEAKWRIFPDTGAAGLWSTATDIALMVLELQKAKAGMSNRVLSQQMASLIFAPVVENVGLGVFLAGKEQDKYSRFRIRGSDGAIWDGYICTVAGYIDHGQSAVVLTNAANGYQVSAELIRAIAEEYKWPAYVQHKKVAVVDPKEYAAFVGNYQLNPNTTITISVEDGKLFAFYSGGIKLELFPESETKFFNKHEFLWETGISFVKAQNGETEMILQIRYNEYRLKRTQ